MPAGFAFNRRLSTVSLAAMLVGCAAGAPKPARMPEDGWTASSPGQQVHVQLRLMDLGGTARYPKGARLYYRAALGPDGARTEVMPWSPLGITRRDQSFVDGLTLVSQETTVISEDYVLPRGKRDRNTNRGTELTVRWRNANGAGIELVFRVFDDGFAFRYRFPESVAGTFVITGETTGFRLPEGARAFVTQHGRPGVPGSQYKTPWQQDLPVGTPAPVEAGWSLPALFRTKDTSHWLLVTEAGLDRNYSGAHLAPHSDGGVYRIRFPERWEAETRGDATPSVPSLPWATPWRVVIAGDRLATIVESTLVTDLAPATTLADTSWIKAGRASWSWWSDGNSPKVFTRLLPFVDLAAQMGWEYATIGPGWDLLEGGSWQELVRYAASKRVGLLFWYNSGGPHNATPQGPRDRLHAKEVRREELRRLAVAGVKGIAVDHFGSDKQAMVKLYLDLLEDAAKSKLVVALRGATIPRGWERTYPHLLTMESVRGSDGYKDDPAFASYGPAHNTIQVFTRNAIGPMDYAPVTFSHSSHKHRTTWAHELALSVVFESGIQHFADSVDGYARIPEEAQAFLQRVPVAWDETRLLEGEPGRRAVVARRKGRDWYVGAISAESTDTRVTVPTDFLGNGTFDMLLIADARSDSSLLITKRQRNPTDTQAVHLRPFGGFAMRFVPLH